MDVTCPPGRRRDQRPVDVGSLLDRRGDVGTRIIINTNININTMIIIIMIIMIMMIIMMMIIIVIMIITISPVRGSFFVRTE